MDVIWSCIGDVISMHRVKDRTPNHGESHGKEHGKQIQSEIVQGSIGISDRVK